MIFIGIIFLIVFLICSGITFLFYYTPKKLGYPKVGIVLASIVGLFFIYVTITDIYADELFSKSDAEQLLIGQDIELNDDFELVQNESMTAIGDYYHTFTLKITKKDKERIIKEIQASKNFHLNKPLEPHSMDREDYYNGSKQIKNYETEHQFIREFFEPHGDGYAPTWRKIEIDKKKDNLIFEDIDE
jgi:hypothetical protein